MEEIVLKREASVTSAEALDQIAESYPDAEILSFRKIKEAGADGEFFITRIRVAATADESDDVVLDSEDIVIEDKQHEDKEEEKMNKIIDLLEKLVDEEETEEKEEAPAVVNETPDIMSDDHERKPLPKPQQPPLGVAGVGSGITPVASVVVERPADVSKAAARVELIREFSKDFKVGEIKKAGNAYRVSLVKRSEDEGEGDWNVDRDWSGEESNWLERRQQMEENERAYRQEASERAKQKEKGNRPPARDIYEDPNYKKLAGLAKRWIGLMDEAGAEDDDILGEIEWLAEMSPAQQEATAKERFKEWRKYGQDYVPGYTVAPTERQSVDPEAQKLLSELTRSAEAQLSSAQKREDSLVAVRRLKDLKDLNDMILRVPKQEQLSLVQSIYGERPVRPSIRNIRNQIFETAKPLLKTDVAAPVEQAQPKQRRAPARPKGMSPYYEHLYDTYGPGKENYDKLRWQREQAEYKKNPEEAEKGWASV